MKARLKMPRSLRGQFILLLLGVLIVVQAVSVALFIDERHKALRIATAKEAASRVLTVAAELERAPADLQAALLRVAQSHDLRLSLDGVALSQADDARSLDHLTRGVRHIVHAPPERALGIALGRPDPAAQRERREADWDGDPYEMVVSAVLADGRWLNARIDIGEPPLQWALPAFISMALTAAAVIAVVWLLVSRIARPMAALARAADRLGRGEALAPLPLSGPAEVRRVTDAFNDMAERLTRLLAERSRMLAAIGHDLRSPITAMRVRLELVDDEESKQRLEACLDEIQSLVEAALALARGASTTEARVPVHLPDLLQEVAEQLSDNGGTVSVEVRDDVTVSARAGGLKRALRNIAENAVRYGGAAEVTLTRTAGRAHIEIADRGPGIPEADRVRVFEPFVRLETSRSRETGGAGLGLAIARAVIDSHGGSIRLAAREGGGTTAVIELPLS